MTTLARPLTRSRAMVALTTLLTLLLLLAPVSAPASSVGSSPTYISGGAGASCVSCGSSGGSSSITSSLTPSTTSTFNLGSGTKLWANVFGQNSYVYLNAGDSFPSGALIDNGSNGGALLLGPGGSTAEDVAVYRSGTNSVALGASPSGTSQVSFNSSTGTLDWTNGLTPTLSEDTTSAATGTAFTIVPQQSTSANPTGGPFIINLQAPGGSGGEAFVQIARGGTTETWIGNQPSGGPGAAGVWLGTATPTSTNYRLLGLTNSYINSSAGSVILQAGGGTVITANATSVLFGSTADMGNFALKNVKTVTYDQEVADSCATTVTINWTAGQKHALTVTGNCTVSFTNPLGPCNTIVRIIQGGSGGFTVTWPSSTTQKWPGGTAPVITSAAGSVDIVSEYWSGSAYYGTFAQAFQ